MKESALFKLTVSLPDRDWRRRIRPVVQYRAPARNTCQKGQKVGLVHKWPFEYLFLFSSPVATVMSVI